MPLYEVPEQAKDNFWAMFWNCVWAQVVQERGSSWLQMGRRRYLGQILDGEQVLNGPHGEGHDTVRPSEERRGILGRWRRERALFKTNTLKIYH